MGLVVQKLGINKIWFITKDKLYLWKEYKVLGRDQSCVYINKCRL